MSESALQNTHTVITSLELGNSALTQRAIKDALRGLAVAEHPLEISLQQAGGKVAVVFDNECGFTAEDRKALSMGVGRAVTEIVGPGELPTLPPRLTM